RFRVPDAAAGGRVVPALAAGPPRRPPRRARGRPAPDPSPLARRTAGGRSDPAADAAARPRRRGDQRPHEQDPARRGGAPDAPPPLRQVPAPADGLLRPRRGQPLPRGGPGRDHGDAAPVAFEALAGGPHPRGGRQLRTAPTQAGEAAVLNPP